MPDGDVVLDHLLGISQQIGELRNEVEGLRGELLGNGQPGRVQRIETELRGLWSKLGKHQSWIDQKRGFMAAVAAGTSAVTWLLLSAAKSAFASALKLYAGGQR